MGYGSFSLCVIHKEGLCRSSGDINRLMMMMASKTDCDQMAMICTITDSCRFGIMSSKDISKCSDIRGQSRSDMYVCMC
jgi:hypothetical protein